MKNLVKLSAILVVMMAAVAMLCTYAGAAGLSDINNHWSKQYVEYGVEKGYISGYEDSTFRPDKTVTRAEFSKMINTAVGLSKTGTISFNDVKRTDWFYSEVCKAVSAGYVSGYDDGTFKPNNVITRQEAAVILSRITLPVSDVSASAKLFADSDKIGDWAVDAVEQMLEKKYFSGDDNNRFLPQDGLTRGQAAKIIYMFMSNENIRVSDYTVDSKDGKLSEVLFVGNVTIKNSNVEFDDCRVLGNVTLSGDESTVKFNNTIVNNVINNSKDSAIIELDKNSNAKEILLNYAADISGDNIEKVTLCGDDLLSGTVELSGEIDQVVVQKDTVLKIYDSAEKVTVEDTVNLIIQSAEIKEFVVNSAAKDSTITLSNGVQIQNAQVNAAVSFIGKGKIIRANNAVTGISYETKPVTVTGKASIGDGKEGGLDNPEITPKNAATDVEKDSNITISFDEQLYNANSRAITPDYIKDILLVTKSSTSGTEVDFTVTISSGKRIVINPVESLSEKTKYYVTIPENKLYNEDGDSNALIRTYFTTEDSGVISGIKFAPANNATDVDIDTNITLTFDEAMYRASGSSLTAAYIQSSVVQLREGSATGTLVDFEADINSTKKIITIVPDSNLKPGTKYYVIVAANTLSNKDGDKNSKVTSYFKTSSTLFAQVTPSNASTGQSTLPEIVIEFSEAVTKPSGASVTSSYITDSVVELHHKTATGTDVAFTASISSDKKKITIIPDEELENNTKYYIIINEETLVGKTSDVLNEKMSVYFTTASNMAPIVTPANAKKDVSTDTNITLKFGSELYTKGTTSDPRKPIDAEYIKDNEVVLLRRTSQTGTKIACDIEISSDGKTITLIPEEVLEEDTKYYVILKKQTLYNEDKKYNSAATTYFTTAKTLIPEFVPSDDDTDVDVNSNIEIIFHENVYAADGSALTTTYLQNDSIKLYKGTSSKGTPVEFAVTLSSDKRTFTVNPNETLAGQSNYYIEVAAGSLTNSSGSENPKAYAVFTTGQAAVKQIVFTPETKETGVSVSVAPTITFESKIYKIGGAAVTDEYLKDYVKLRVKSASTGTVVDADVSISADKKTITITPRKDLDSNTKYYIVLTASKFQYSSDSKVGTSTKSAYFTTGSSKAELKSFEEVETFATTATFSFTSNVAGKMHITATPSGSGTSLTFEKNVVAGEDERVEIEGLKTNTAYTVKAYVETTSGAKSETLSANIETLSAFEFEVAEVTDSSASVRVVTNTAGNLTITYKNVNTGHEETKVSNISMTSGKDRTITIDSLESNTQYNITAEFTCPSDEVVKDTVNVLTEDSSIYLVPTSITIQDSEGDTYEVEFDGETTAQVSILGGESVKVKVGVNNKAQLKINDKTVSNGQYSSSISLDDNGQATITIEVSYNGNSQTYTIDVAVS